MKNISQFHINFNISVRTASILIRLSLRQQNQISKKKREHTAELYIMDIKIILGIQTVSQNALLLKCL